MENKTNFCEFEDFEYFEDFEKLESIDDWAKWKSTGWVDLKSDKHENPIPKILEYLELQGYKKSKTNKKNKK